MGLVQRLEENINLRVENQLLKEKLGQKEDWKNTCNEHLSRIETLEKENAQLNMKLAQLNIRVIKLETDARADRIHMVKLETDARADRMHMVKLETALTNLRINQESIEAMFDDRKLCNEIDGRILVEVIGAPTDHFSNLADFFSAVKDQVSRLSEW